MPEGTEIMVQVKNRLREDSRSTLKQSKQEKESEKQKLLLKRREFNKQKQEQLEKNTQHSDIDIQIEQLQTKQSNVNEELKQEQVKIDQTIEDFKQRGRQLKDDFNQTNQELESKLVQLKAAKSQEFETKERDLKSLQEKESTLNDHIQNFTKHIDDITSDEKQIEKGLEDVPVHSTYVRMWGCLSDYEQNTIRKNWCYLLDKIRNPLHLVQTLYSKGVFNDDDCDQVKRIYKECSTRQAVEEILTKIQGCGPGALNKFVHCLTPACLIGVDEQQIAGEAMLILEETEKKVYPQTRAYHEACGILQEHLVVGVIGATGDGKSILSRMVANNFIQKNPEFLPIFIKDPSEIPFDSSHNCLLIMDDMMGKYDVSVEEKKKWSRLFSRLFTKHESKQFALIYAMRDYSYNEMKYFRTHFKICSDSYCVFLYHDQYRLNDSERKAILKYHRTSLDNATLTTIVEQMSNCFGFPAFAEILGAASPDYPLDICKTLNDFLDLSFETFRKDHKSIYFCICLVFCKHVLPMSQIHTGFESQHLLTKLDGHVEGSFSPSSVLDNCKYLSNSFLDAEVTHGDTNYFLRRHVDEAFLVYFYQRSPSKVLEFSPVRLLMEKITTKPPNQTSLSCQVHQCMFSDLFQRFKTEIESNNDRVLFHQAFLDEQFLHHCMNKEISDILFNVNDIHLNVPTITNDRGSFLHYICLLGNSSCLQTLLPHVSDKLLTGKSEHGHDIVDLAVLSNIDIKVKFDLLSHEKYHHLLPPKKNIVYLAARSNSREFLNQVSCLKSVNIAYVDARKRSALHAACQSDYDNAQIIAFLLRKNLDVNSKDDEGCTPLLLALRNGKGKTVEYLLNHGSSVNASDTMGKSALHVSCSSNAGRLDVDTEGIVTLLVDAGCDINKPDNAGRTPLHEAVAHSDHVTTEYLLFKGAERKSEKIVSEAFKTLKNHTGLVDTILQSSDFPLHDAALYCQDISHFKTILGRYCDKINTIDMQKETPLHKACISPYCAIDKINILNTRGADSTILSNPSTGFILNICRHSTVSVLNMLLDYGVPLDIKQSTGTTLLHVCCQSDVDQVEKVKLLVSKGCFDINACNQFCGSVLHYGAQYCSVETVRILKDAGANIEVMDHFGNNVLFNCLRSKFDQEEKLQLLTSREKVGWVNSCYEDGVSVLHYSAQYCSMESVQIIIDAGANIEALDRNGDNVLFSCLRSMVDQERKLKLLLSSTEGWVNCCNKDGVSVLHYSAQYCSVETVQIIIYAGANIEAIDHHGNNVLFSCLKSSVDQERKLKLLLSRGKESWVNSCDVNGVSVLNYGAEYCSVESVQIIIEAGANIEAIDHHGNSVLFYCCKCKTRNDPVETIKYVVSKGYKLSVSEKNTLLQCDDITSYLKYVLTTL